MGFQTYYNMDYDRHQPLKYRYGDEKSKSIVVYASVVTLDNDSRRLVNRGEVLCEITSGTGDGKYGPYSGTATDGRQNLTNKMVVVAQNGLDVTLGDRPIAGLFADCVFDLSGMTLDGISAHSTALEAAFPQCTFDD